MSEGTSRNFSSSNNGEGGLGDHEGHETVEENSIPDKPEKSDIQTGAAPEGKKRPSTLRPKLGISRKNPKRVTEKVDKANSKQHHLIRFILFLQELHTGVKRTPNEFAQRIGVTRRVFNKYLKQLREPLNLVIKQDEDGFLEIIPGSNILLPPMQFTSEEAFSLIALCQSVQDEVTGKALSFFSPAYTAAIKLMTQFPSEIQNLISVCRRRISFKDLPSSNKPEKQDIFYSLLQASAERFCVEIMYDSVYEGRNISTVLMPYKLFFNHHSWYVVGRSFLHQQVRTFNIGRINSLEKMRKKFHIPLGWSLGSYHGNAWNMIREEKDYEVRVRFSPMVARNVAEVKWHHTQRTFFYKDGSLDFTVTVSGLREISWWILGYGDQAEVIMPQELREIIARSIMKMGKTYAKEMLKFGYDFTK